MKTRFVIVVVSCFYPVFAVHAPAADKQEAANKSTAAPWYVALATNIGYRHYAHNRDRFYNCDWMIGPSLFAFSDQQPVEPNNIEIDDNSNSLPIIQVDSRPHGDLWVAETQEL